MGELVQAYKRLRTILPNNENIKSKRSILEQAIFSHKFLFHLFYFILQALNHIRGLMNALDIQQ